MEDIYLFNIHLIYYLIAVAFILPRIPVVGKFFNIINTLIHEFGHAFTALLLQGEVKKIQIFSNTSGVTQTKSKSSIAAFFVSISGYPFASLTAFLCFFLLSVGYELWIICGLSVLFLFMMILWIRNSYGIIWVLLFIAINGSLFYLNNPVYTSVAAWFYALMILWESCYSTFVLLYLSIAQPDAAGDATNLQKQTHIPAFLWSILFCAFAVWMAYTSCTLPNGILELISK